MIEQLKASIRNLKERLIAHAERHIEGERDAVEMVGMANEIETLINRLVAPGTPVVPVEVAALHEANELAVTIGQFQSRMFGMAEYHDRLAEHGRRLRKLLNAAGYVAPGSVLEG